MKKIRKNYFHCFGHYTRIFGVFSFSWFLVLGSWLDSAFADSQSPSYKLESEVFSGGGNLQLTSAAYKIEEAGIDWIGKVDLTGANYRVDATIGIYGNEPIAIISSTTPGNFSKFYTDQSASFTVNASSPDGDPLTYEAKQDSVSKAGPQTSNILSWALGAADKGRRNLDLIVSEQHGTVVNQQAMYVYRRPVK